MNDTSLWKHCIKLEEPTSKGIVAHSQNISSSASNINSNTHSTSLLQTRIGIYESCAESPLFPLTRDYVHFQIKSELQKRRRLRNISIETFKDISFISGTISNGLYFYGQIEFQSRTCGRLRRFIHLI